ncbi:hypothetical protein [Deinococcus aestuarii]|uniref:hypothetical protein n=1 Tax=Deinococcus aestuarii TaxID=2774531 RepID=UPI001C0D2CB0|nr:hypothetical protein [Deinococcus aestuarii]
MNALDRQSERFSATGNLVSEGALNPLGRPSHDLLTVLSREAVQNSWDARAHPDGPVNFTVSGWIFTPQQLQVLRDHVFPDVPQGLPLDIFHHGHELTGLLIADSGTTGLEGPTRADAAGAPGERRRFVSFLRNVGRGADEPVGGGTFGYGKSVLYRASRVRTICVFSRCKVNGINESRFMAAALGGQYAIGASLPDHGLYTGRHWWGRRAHDGVVDPVLGTDAETLARVLGLAEAVGDRGTAVLVLDPDFGGRSGEDALAFMARTTMWYCWPKTLAVSSEAPAPAMRFDFRWQGGRVPLPDPRVTPPLDRFVAAFEALAPKKGARTPPFHEVKAVRMQRPVRELGRTSLIKFPSATSVAPPLEGAVEAEWPVAGACRHVALLRGPKLVVKYLQGPALPAPGFEYAGVFLADPALDAVYARSETPTHDDWRFEFLQDAHEKSCVRVGLRRLKEILLEFTAVPRIEAGTHTPSVVAGFAEFLGVLLPGEEGVGASVLPHDPAVTATSRPTRVSPRAGRRAVVEVRPDVRFILEDGTPRHLLTFTVKHPERAVGTFVRAHPRVVVDGNAAEEEPPAGQSPAVVTAWITPWGETFKTGGGQWVPADLPGDWQVEVSAAHDAVLEVRFEVQAEAGP